MEVHNSLLAKQLEQALAQNHVLEHQLESMKLRLDLAHSNRALPPVEDPLVNHPAFMVRVTCSGETLQFCIYPFAPQCQCKTNFKQTRAFLAPNESQT